MLHHFLIQYSPSFVVCQDFEFSVFRLNLLPRSLGINFYGTTAMQVDCYIRDTHNNRLRTDYEK